MKMMQKSLNGYKMVLLFLLLLIACKSRQQNQEATNTPAVNNSNDTAVVAKKEAEATTTTQNQQPSERPQSTTTPETAGVPTVRMLFFDSWEATMLPVFEDGSDIGGLDSLSAWTQTQTTLPTVICTPGNFLPGDSNDRRPAIAAMNLIGLNVSGLGKLELNYGPKTLVKQLQTAKFPVISANVYQGDHRLFPAFVIREVAGLRLAVVAITSEEAAVQAQPTAIAGLLFKDPVQEVKKTVAELANKADLIILLSNLRHNEDLKLAQEVSGIALIIGRYDVEPDHRQAGVATTLILRPNKKRGGEVGVVAFVQQDGQWTAQTPKFYTIGPKSAECQNLPAPAASQELIHKWQAEEKEMAEVLSQTEVLLEGDYQKVRQQESNLGNLLADILLSSRPQADIAVLNSGCIRASIPIGPITKGALAAVLPYENKVVELVVTGDIIKEMLENSVAQYQKVSGAFLQIAGLSYVFDPQKPAFTRVAEIKIHGEPIVPTKSYRLVTLSYLSTGGDDYIMLKDKEQTFMSAEGFPQIVAEYLKQKPKVSTGVEGRIQKADTE